jgi:hypothetical protein
MAILIGHNTTTGVSTYAHADPDNPNGVIYSKHSDAQAVLDVNAEQRAITEGARFGESRHVARIPAHIMGQLVASGAHLDRAYMRKFVRDNPQFQTFGKTW